MINFAHGVDGADSFRYIYVLNYTGQTVSVIDQASNTVIATITLTAAKALRSIFYRSVSKSVYVLTTNWFDRIDADPASGSFNTVVGSGALTSNSAMSQYTYFPYIDAIGVFAQTAPGLLFFDSSHNILGANTVTATSQFRPVFPNLKVGRHFNAGAIEQPLPLVSSQVRFTKNGYVIAPQPQAYSLFKIDSIGGNKYELKDITPRSSFLNVGYPAMIGDLITAQQTTAMYILDLEYKSILYGFSISPSDRVSHKFCQRDQKIFCYQRINTNINLSVIDWKTKTDLGDISRAAYKATDENCTRQGLYSPYNGFFYVLGGNTAGAGTVDKVHYYDPSQVLASMYQASITVGNSATAPVDYYENAMCFNGIERFGHNDNSF